MKILKTTQWLIALVFIAYSVAAANDIGTLVIMPLLLGLLLCGLAAWVSKLTIVPVLFSALVDALLMFFSFNLMIGQIRGIREDATIQLNKFNYDNYMSFDLLLCFAVFSLTSIYIAAVALNFKKLH